MSLIEEQFSQQFSEWEQRGRGWQLWDFPVSPEPAFRPFPGYALKDNPIPDDGRRPTFLSALFQRIARGLADEPKELPSEVENDEETEPDLFERGDMVELLASLPATVQISKEVFEQFLASLNNCSEPIAFELIGTQESITVQFVASESDVDVVRHQLEAHFPEAVFTKQASYLEEAWNSVDAEEAVIFEFGLASEFMLQLNVARNFNIDPFIGLTAALSNLRENEVALFQVIFQPVRHSWAESIVRSVTNESGKDFFVNCPELSAEAKRKIARPLFAAVVRLAVKSDSRILDIAKGIAGALTVYSNPEGNELFPLENDEYNFVDHEQDLLRRQSRRSGMILNSEELVSLVHLPSSSVRAPKLKREAQKTKVVPKIALSSHGLLLGINTHAGVTNEVRLTAEQRVRHTYIIGTSGTGKSTLFFNMIRQDMENGQGLAVFDPHGDLIDKILGAIPEHRIDDVVLIDPGDETHSVGFNILSAHSDMEKNLLASDLVSVFQRLSTSWGDQMTSVLNNAILAFLESKHGGTLADLQRFLIEPGFRHEFLKTVTDSQVLYYWHKAFPQLSGNKSIGPVLTRLGSFLDRKPIRHMVTQKQNRLDFADIMNSGKIFLAKLAQGQIGNENAYLLGSFMISKFQQLAMSRQAQAVATRRDFWCYCDEFHNFITPSMAHILTSARKYRMGLILAHQELRQLQRDSEVASAVLSNPYTRICFRVGDDDARKLGDGFSFFDSKDLQNLPNFQALCRVERSDGDFNLSIPYLPEPDEAETSNIRNRIITASREKYAVPRKQIEEEHEAAWVKSDSEQSPQPKEDRTPPAKTAAVDPTLPRVVKKPSVFGNQPESEQPPPTIYQSAAIGHGESVCKPKPRPTDLGRGGAQHKSIQQRLQTEAHILGFLALVESQLTDKSNHAADLTLRKGKQALAIEITVTTTTDHEFGNVKKCLAAGFNRVAVVSPTAERLKAIADAVQAGLGSTEAAKVSYHTPDDLVSELRKLAEEESETADPNQARERVTRGYKVRRHGPALTPEERKSKEDVAIKLMADAMKKPSKQ